jgi:protein-S-isoprenylcysteine O-methyltransferase Ste14
MLTHPYNYIGLLFIVFGGLMVVSVGRQFKKVQTEIHTFKRPKKLVTTGWFRVSRNPIYLGFLLLLLGVWLFLGTLLPIIGCIMFVVITDLWYIPYEEKALEATLGQPYINYKSKVRRWF